MYFTSSLILKRPHLKSKNEQRLQEKGIPDDNDVILKTEVFDRDDGSVQRYNQNFIMESPMCRLDTLECHDNQTSVVHTYRSDQIQNSPNFDHNSSPNCMPTYSKVGPYFGILIIE